MELWVRSQDKELLMKTPELRYKQKGNVHSLLAYDTSGGYRILGVYKSKERAIEILDEIQNIFSLKIENISYNEVDLFLKTKMLNSCYQMPKN